MRARAHMHTRVLCRGGVLHHLYQIHYIEIIFISISIFIIRTKICDDS